MKQGLAVYDKDGLEVPSLWAMYTRAIIGDLSSVWRYRIDV